ncbi:MAG: FAD-dependent 5-carboxymethylaminomethyl-2-thiouridine(34) oxidoreductase MnmC [Burkholderiaceae bacterium]|nr:FAD-dependent 5-carboxymethylaminomethyl-2-thiouridine(34) oxidoreductase MnmC [Burkholderiaceae bacterium]
MARVTDRAMESADGFAITLPALWKDRRRFVVLDDRFDGGWRFQQVLNAWKVDPHRCEQLHVITVSADIVGGCTARPLADEIAGAWPPITPNLHRLAFDGGRVQWLLVPSLLRPALRELVAGIDAFALSAMAAADVPAARRQAKSLARLAGVGTSVFFDVRSMSAGDTMPCGLRSAGFAPDPVPALSPSADDAPGSWPSRWRYAPPFTPRHAPMRSGTGAQSTAPVLVVGAGLAGCAMAWALAEQGRDCIVFERHAAPALETSGNPAGLFHGIVNPQDGAHARFNRAAALEAQRAVSIALTQHGVPGSLRGLLRLETLQDAGEALRKMQATLARLGLSRAYVQALSAQEASAQAGIALRGPAWCYPGGGWVQPGGLARSFLERAGGRASLRGNCAVESLTRGNCGWQLLDARGSTLAESGTVVLANAGDALRLLRPWMPTSQPDAWPFLKVRGQISTMTTEAGSGWPLPRMPITGEGYLLPSVDGRTIFGATSQVGDDDPAVRDSDHRHNLAQLSRLLGVEPQVDVRCFGGRTGWRWTTDDRLPVLGAVPDVAAAMATERLEQPVQVPRLTGLYACTAFGSRGITWAALAAQVVAASITGAPVPIESSLLDSVDAARFATRRSRRGR